MTTLATLKAKSSSLEHKKAKQHDLERNMIVLVYDYLTSRGYVDTAEKLLAESSNNIIKRYEIADNIDLSLIVQEFNAYQQYKYGRKSKIIRKKQSQDHKTGRRRRKKCSTKFPPLPNSTALQRVRSSGDNNNSTSCGMTITTDEDNTCSSIENMSIGGNQIKPTCRLKKYPAINSNDNNNDDDNNDDDMSTTRVLKPLPNWSSDMKLLAENITHDIYHENPNVHWDDIAELNNVKQILKEAIVMPLRFPQFFKGLLRPWQGALLYGPPGTGKTLLAKAVATECNTTFFNVSASSLISKWRGESEKSIRVLFELARYHTPSTIFIDEIDALISSRNSEREHEASRRMKTEFLIQMDGLAKNGDSAVFVLAATNIPWSLDLALLRRLEKRIYVPLPTVEAREIILRKYLQTPTLNYNLLAKRTQGYSGSDIVSLCKEALMRPVRRLTTQLSSLSEHELQHTNASLDTITINDIELAIKSTRPSTDDKHQQQYAQWHSKFGAELSSL